MRRTQKGGGGGLRTRMKKHDWKPPHSKTDDQRLVKQFILGINDPTR